MRHSFGGPSEKSAPPTFIERDDREASPTFVESDREAPPTFVPSVDKRVTFKDPLVGVEAPEEIHTGRRNFLRNAAVASGILAAGATVGVMERSVAETLKESVDTPFADPTQGLLNERSFIFANSVAGNDPESKKIAAEFVDVYSKKIKATGDAITALQGRLAQSSHSSGARAFLENELFLAEEQQRWLVERTQFLRDPQAAYLDALSQQTKK